MAKAQSTSKQEAIAQSLRTQILNGDLRPGDMIPSYRALMALHSTTVNTVRQAVMTLETEGWIEPKPGKGCIVSQPQERRHIVGLAIVGPHADLEFYTEQIAFIHDELDKLGCDIALRLVPTVDDESIEALVSWSAQWAGVFITGFVPAELIKRVADAGVSVVQTGEPFDEECPQGVSSVSVDVYNLIHLAVSHLVSLGHRRIALCSLEGSRYFDMVAEEFRSSIRDCSQIEKGSIWSFGEIGQPMNEGLISWLKDQSDDRPTALLVEGVGRAGSIVKLLSSSPWPVPDKMSVLAISAIEPPFRSATGIINPAIIDSLDGISCVVSLTKEMILRAVDIVLDSMKSNRPIVRVEKVAIKFLPGNSCRPPE